MFLLFVGFFECFKSFTTEQDAIFLVGFINCREARGPLSGGNRILARECRSHVR